VNFPLIVLNILGNRFRANKELCTFGARCGRPKQSSGNLIAPGSEFYCAKRFVEEYAEKLISTVLLARRGMSSIFSYLNITNNAHVLTNRETPSRMMFEIIIS
jgi:hypothetical protein